MIDRVDGVPPEAWRYEAKVEEGNRPSQSNHHRSSEKTDDTSGSLDDPGASQRPPREGAPEEEPWVFEVNLYETIE
jgi:hypothetical protein